MRKNSIHVKEEKEGETSSGTNPPFSKILKPTLRNILEEIINITRSSIATMSKSVIVAWIM